MQHFLRDFDRIPKALSRYHLQEQEDQTTCGQICLSHLLTFNKSRQLQSKQDIRVPISTQGLVPTSSIHKMTKFVSNVMTGKTPVVQFAHVQVPSLPTTRQREVSHGVHEYVSRNWLKHLKYVRLHSEAYKKICNVCLDPTNDFLPWFQKSQTEASFFNATTGIWCFGRAYTTNTSCERQLSTFYTGYCSSSIHYPRTNIRNASTSPCGQHGSCCSST